MSARSALTSGTPSGSPFGSCGPTPGGTAVSGAGYTSTYAYDTLDRLTTGPAGTYTYSESAHLHAVTATSDGHSLAYDAAGNVNCRATASGGCTSAPTAGAPYTFDVEGRLSVWANKPTGATVSAIELSDGAGERVERQATSSGVLTTSVFVGALAESDTTSGVTTTTDYVSFAGKMVAVHDTAWHDLLSDQVGTPEVQVKANGTPELDALKLPYGAGRYAAASLLSLGFTGQRKDTGPNLTYFNARYYDQEVGAFLSADSVAAGGLNRYAYVDQNPETKADPTGHCPWCVIGAIAGAIIGGGIAYGVQVYNNSQNPNFQGNIWTSNIDWGMVGAGALAGVIIGGTMGAGATAAAAVLAGGGSATAAASAGVTSAAMYAAYGAVPAVGAGVAAEDGEQLLTDDALDLSRPGSAVRFRTGNGLNYPDAQERYTDNWGPDDYVAQARATANYTGVDLQVDGQDVNIKYLGKGEVNVPHYGHWSEEEPGGFGLYKEAFFDEPTLTRTLVHEMQHVTYYAEFGVPSGEPDAYAAEDDWMLANAHRFGWQP